MRRHRKSVWTNSTASIAISVIFGIILILFISLLLSAVMYYILGDMRVAKVFSVLSMSAGTCISTYFCGKYRRKRGLADGIICGTVIYIVVMTAGFIFMGEFVGIKKLLLLTVSGATGGVMGVNSKRPKNFTE